MESKVYPGSYYQPLFDLLNQEHGITPLESEMADIIVVVEKMREAQTGARWVKADTKPEHNLGVLVFIPGEDNHITSGMWDVSNEWVLLDEYRIPEEEVTHWMPLPAFPEGYTWNEIPDVLVDALKKAAREEFGKLTQSRADFIREANNRDLDGAGRAGWISVQDRLPDEGGRYWCYLKDINDLGTSYFQWNCAYNANEKRFSDSTLFNGEQVTHWRKLPEPPKQQKEK